jgi:hypothetical protein
MYSELFSKRVAVEETIPINPEMMQDNDMISDFLAQQGYRDISVKESRINAVRGHKIWNLMNIGDPRRNYHSTEVSVSSDVISVKTHIDAWFGLGTKYDKAVFAAEIEMLRHFLQTRELSLAPLQEAQARRRKSDLMTFLIIIGVGILIGIGVVKGLG